MFKISMLQTMLVKFKGKVQVKFDIEADGSWLRSHLVESASRFKVKRFPDDNSWSASPIWTMFGTQV